MENTVSTAPTGHNTPRTVDVLAPQSAPPTPNVTGGYQYPDTFPLASVQAIVQIITGNKVAAQKAAFGKHIWVVQGYALMMLLGDPDANASLDLNLIGTSRTSPNTDVVVGILNSLVDQRDPSKLHTQAAENKVGDTLVKLSAPTALATVLQWSITKLLELVEQELVAAVV